MRSQSERGQTLVETLVVMPVMVFAVLGAVQVMLIAHGRIMTEYAAYCAARAGIVHNANWNVMRNAAMLAALPLYERTDTPGRFFSTWARVKAASEMTEAVDTGVATIERLAGDLVDIEMGGFTQDISFVEVEVTNPTQEVFDAWRAHRQAKETAAAAITPQGKLAYPGNDREIDFDDLTFLEAHPDASRLAVDVRVLYPLKIPFVSKILFELFVANVLLDAREFRSDLGDWARFRTRIKDGSAAGQYLDDAVENAPGAFGDFFRRTQWNKEIATLRDAARRFGVYLIPLKASYAMNLQSNMFQSTRREPVWFSLE